MIEDRRPARNTSTGSDRPAACSACRSAGRSLVVLLLALLSGTVLAQDDPPLPPNAEPPPIKVISKEERQQLADAKDIKNRVKLSLELMDRHLLVAEGLSMKGEYKAMFKELGKFQALVDNALAHLNRNDTGRSRFLKHFKRFEMGLRDFLPRLELIRRDVPVSYEYYVRVLILAVREARQKAVDPFFDDSVVPGNKNSGLLVPLKTNEIYA